MLRVYGVVSGSSVANNSYQPPAVVVYDPEPSSSDESVQPSSSGELVQSTPVAGPVRTAPGFTG